VIVSTLKKSQAKVPAALGLEELSPGQVTTARRGIEPGLL
jgi:hypothetical protein